MLRKALFYVLLGVATVGLSHLFNAWRAWRVVPTVAGGAAVVVFGLAVLGAMLWLGFLLYEVDRAAGRVRHRVGIYEWVIGRLHHSLPRQVVSVRHPGVSAGKRPEVRIAAHRGGWSGAAGGERRG